MRTPNLGRLADRGICRDRVGLLLALIALNRGGELPLFVVQLDLLVLAAGTAYLLDDVAKSVTDVVPTSCCAVASRSWLRDWRWSAAGGRSCWRSATG